MGGEGKMMIPLLLYYCEQTRLFISSPQQNGKGFVVEIEH